ncbi:hypothetical protein BJ508DRAFT_84353 [Ascobolus immersus RN42]|uniref:Uncharacterized protein n=1 Tax=Ascobolus immersus RN42 TaxID=1160509 RepID=A0A3N4IBE0_ASCIM|nr:hypothetical protein BJ508DRAFT_84353 [Ascobolus immersus RN42]
MYGRKAFEASTGGYQQRVKRTKIKYKIRRQKYDEVRSKMVGKSGFESRWVLSEETNEQKRRLKRCNCFFPSALESQSPLPTPRRQGARDESAWPPFVIIHAANCRPRNLFSVVPLVCSLDFPSKSPPHHHPNLYFSTLYSTKSRVIIPE